MFRGLLEWFSGGSGSHVRKLQSEPGKVTKIRMPDGIVFESYVSVETFNQAWMNCLQSGGLLELVSDKGVKRLVNPYQIIYASEQ
jgi:hypothetical protein